MRRGTCFLFYSLFFYVTVLPQVQPFGGAYLGGTLRIHPQYPAQTQPSWAISTGIERKIPDADHWTARYGYPRIRFSLSWAGLGNPDVLGQAIGGQIGLAHEFYSKRNWAFGGTVNIGLAWLSKPFDRQQNPGNTALGARFTNLTSGELYLVRQLTRYQIRVGFAYWHYSSARARLPNLGINLPMATLTLARGKLTHGRLPVPNKEDLDIDAWAWYLRGGLGRVSRKVAGGPQHWIWGLSTWGSWQPGPKLRYVLGAKVFQERSLIAFFKDQDFGFEHPSREAIGAVTFTGVEVMFGRFGLHLWLGPYLRRPELMPYTLFTELGGHYYLPHLLGGNRLFLSAAVQAHGGDADFAEWGLGFRF